METKELAEVALLKRRDLIAEQLLRDSRYSVEEAGSFSKGASLAQSDRLRTDRLLYLVGPSRAEREPDIERALAGIDELGSSPFVEPNQFAHDTSIEDALEGIDALASEGVHVPLGRMTVDYERGIAVIPFETWSSFNPRAGAGAPSSSSVAAMPNGVAGNLAWKPKPSVRSVAMGALAIVVVALLGYSVILLV
jgi:hypothetical protein